LTKPIKITVKGTDHRGDDTPTVDDLLTQIQDFVFILREVESVISENGQGQIVWHVTNVTKNSPLTFEITPYPKHYAVNVDNRAEQVVSATANGFKEISDTGQIPMYFSKQVVDRAVKVYSRVTNGLASTMVDFSEYEDAPNFEATPQIARQAVSRIQEAQKPAPIAHRELGSLEGYIAKIELDGFGRPLVWLRSRLDGQIVKCVSSKKGLDRIGHFEVDEVLRGLRVRVHGLLNYKDLDQISTIDVEGVHVFEPDKDLPKIGSIVAPGFTGGMEASAYLEALRKDG